MTYQQLFEMLAGARINPDTIIRAKDIYGEGEFEITGMEYDRGEVFLTSETKG